MFPFTKSQHNLVFPFTNRHHDQTAARYARSLAHAFRNASTLRLKLAIGERIEQGFVDVALRLAEVDAHERHRTTVGLVGIGIALLADLSDRRGRERKNWVMSQGWG